MLRSKIVNQLFKQLYEEPIKSGCIDRVARTHKMGLAKAGVHQLRVDDFQIPPHRRALNVSGKRKKGRPAKIHTEDKHIYRQFNQNFRWTFCPPASPTFLYFLFFSTSLFLISFSLTAHWYIWFCPNHSSRPHRQNQKSQFCQRTKYNNEYFCNYLKIFI